MVTEEGLVLDFGLDDGDVPKGVKWSPDGTCLLTARTQATRLVVFELSERIIEKALTGTRASLFENGWKPIFECLEAESIRDYAWYPKMNSSHAISCCFISASKDQPMHLWDAYSGALRASYPCWNEHDRVVGPISLAFSQDGTKIYSGSDGLVHLFHTGEPGKICELRKTRKTRRSKEGQHGLIGALATYGESLYAAGSYKGSLGIYDDRLPPEQGAAIFISDQATSAHGITALQFNSNGIRLFVGSRAERPDAYIRVFDLRRPNDPCLFLPRAAASNQRLGFHLYQDDTTFATATDHHGASIFHLNSESKHVSPCIHIQARVNDVVNDCHFHPHLPLIATSLGQHRFLHHALDRPPRNAIQVWLLPTSAYAPS